MFNWDDILIIGDSFCADRDQENFWPQKLALTLTSTKFDPTRIPRGEGFPGAAWWSVRNRLLLELEVKVPKVLVLCHTDSMRIPSDFDFPINCWSGQPHPAPQVPWIPIANKFRRNANGDILKYEIHTHHKHFHPDIATAANMYYRWLLSENYHNWAQMQWFREADEIISQHDIPYCIHMHLNHTHVFNTGITIVPTLLDMCKETFDTPNHFTIDQNIKLASELVNAINNYSASGQYTIEW